MGKKSQDSQSQNASTNEALRRRVAALLAEADRLTAAMTDGATSNEGNDPRPLTNGRFASNVASAMGPMQTSKGVS